MTDFRSTAFDPRYDARSSREELVMPILIYVGLLLSLPTGGLSFIAALIAAYVLKRDAGPAAWSHYVYAIRTCWGWLALCVVGGLMIAVGLPLMIVLIGFPIIFLGGAVLLGAKLWLVVRAVVGIVRAAAGDAQPNPRAVLV